MVRFCEDDGTLLIMEISSNNTLVGRCKRCSKVYDADDTDTLLYHNTGDAKGENMHKFERFIVNSGKDELNQRTDTLCNECGDFKKLCRVSKNEKTIYVCECDYKKIKKL